MPGDLRERQRSNLPSPRRLEPQTRDGQVLEAIWGSEGGGDGLEALMLGFKRGDIMGQLQDSIADVCCVGRLRDVCEKWEHGECCDGEDHGYWGTPPPTPGRLLPS